MSEFTDFSASTESAAPQDSTVDVTASASGEGAPVQAESEFLSGATVPDTTDGQVSAGWSLEDEPEPEQSAIPEDDSDIPEDVQGIDQQRVAGLVNALRSARREAREQAKAARTAAQLQQQLEPYGGYEGVEQMATFVNTLFAPTDERGEPLPDGSTVPFLSQLYQASQERYARLVSDVVTAHPEHAIQLLQQAGKLPESLTGQPGAGHVDEAVYEALPPHLREVYRNLPPSLRNEYDLMKDEARNALLQEKYDFQQMRSEQEQARQQAWQEKVTQAQTKGTEAADALVRQYEEAHYNALSKWQPFGPENQQSNQRLYRSVVEGSLSELLRDQKYAALYADARQLQEQAPLLRLHGEQARAAQYEREARHKAAQFNAALSQRLREAVKEYDQVFRDARAWREQQRQQIPQRTEIPGQGAAFSARRSGVQILDANGNLSADFKRQLADSLGG